jgi:DNA-binding NarL/FixJ family response regulator
MKLLIVDDHAIVRRGLIQILDEEKDFRFECDEAANGQEAIAKVGATSYDLVLLDISMPGRNGLDVLKQIKQENQKLPVLIISMHPEEQYAIRALRAGAAGYLTKESAPDELRAAIKKVIQGGRYVSNSLSERLSTELNRPRRRADTLHGTLSDREYQVLCMLASGKTVKDISVELDLSDKTISTYRARILAKMHMNTTAQLINYAIKEELVK